MREKEIETKLKQEVEKRGGMALKFMCPGMRGMPDRLVLLPGRKVVFVELKAPGKKMRPLQHKRKAQLESLGFKVLCINRLEVVPNEVHTL